MSERDKITDELDDFSDDDSTLYNRRAALQDDDDDSLDDEEEEEEEEEPEEEGTNAPKNEEEEASDVSDVDEDEDEAHLKKLDRTVRTHIVQEFHPEIVYRSTEEIEKLVHVVRNRQGQIIDPIHRSLPLLTKYEKARLLGERAKQLEEGAQPFVKVDAEIVDSYVIAEMELKEKAMPFILERPMPNGGCEYWQLVDLEVI